MTWKGEPVAGDVVVTAQPGVLDHARGHFIGYVEGVEHLGAVAPLDAGTLELRYLSAGTVAARRTLTVTPNPATLKVIDDAVFVGSVFHVVWTGPNGPKDYVIIVPGEASRGGVRNVHLHLGGVAAHHRRTHGSRGVRDPLPERAATWGCWPAGRCPSADGRVPGHFDGALTTHM